MLAPKMMPIAPLRVMAWLIPMATVILVTAVLLWVSDVTTIPARMPSQGYCPIMVSALATQGINTSVSSASDM